MNAKKIVIFGDFAVGKTSLIKQFVDRQFKDEYLVTIGVKLSRKLIRLAASNNSERQEQEIELIIWDIEGQGKFSSVSSTYLQGASGAIIVSDLTRPETITNVSEHIELVSSLNPKGIGIIVALNKADLLDERQIENSLKTNQFSNYPQVLATYVTSAKTGQNVEKIFKKLAEYLILHKF